MAKLDRLKAIESLIIKYEIDTQEELTEKLIDLGFNVSQSTVSRDINELNLIKVNGNVKKTKYVMTSVVSAELSPQLVGLFKQVTVSFSCANNLLVIKTLSGNASSAAMAFDEMKFPQVLGTVAGDDTVLVVAKTNSDAEIILKRLRNL